MVRSFREVAAHGDTRARELVALWLGSGRLTSGILSHLPDASRSGGVSGGAGHGADVRAAARRGKRAGARRAAARALAAGERGGRRAGAVFGFSRGKCANFGVARDRAGAVLDRALLLGARAVSGERRRFPAADPIAVTLGSGGALPAGASGVRRRWRGALSLGRVLGSRGGAGF